MKIAKRLTAARKRPCVFHVMFAGDVHEVSLGPDARVRMAHKWEINGEHGPLKRYRQLTVTRLGDRLFGEHHGGTQLADGSWRHYEGLTYSRVDRIVQEKDGNGIRRRTPTWTYGDMKIVDAPQVDEFGLIVSKFT